MVRGIMLLMFIMSMCSLVVVQVYGGKLLETESFVQFIRAIDPMNLLMARWNGSIVDLCIDRWACIRHDVNSHAITEIRLENLNLSGILDADSLCKLQSLRVLSLAKNLIKGTIPDSISNCTSLKYFNLSNNLLHGLVPLSLNNLKNLTSIDISNNRFSQFVVNFSQEVEHGYQAYSTLEVSRLDHITMNHSQYLGTPTNLLSIAAVSPSSNYSSYDTKDERQRKLVLDGILLMLGIGLFALFLFLMSKRAPKSDEDKKEVHQPSLEEPSVTLSASPRDVKETKQKEKEGSELVFFVDENERFKLEDLLQSAADLQGQSLCSSLYMVTLKNNSVFAVKRLKQLMVSGEEFGNTMSRIGNLKHPNVLTLVAYHYSNEEKLLIYRFQKNGSLLSLLEKYSDGKRDFPWRHRLSIAYGIAQGLNFIHRSTSNGEKIIPHGNLKLSNIILNENEEPLISEHGYLRCLDPAKACLFQSNGYRAPERSLTAEGDVFSFGVILLELLTGKTVERSGLDLPKWVKAMVREEWTGEVFDKEVNRAGKQWAFPLLNVALKCVSHLPKDRPNMEEVLDKIEEVLNAQDDFSFSSTSSADSIPHESCLLHTVIPEILETPRSGSDH